MIFMLTSLTVNDIYVCIYKTHTADSHCCHHFSSEKERKSKFIFRTWTEGRARVHHLGKGREIFTSHLKGALKARQRRRTRPLTESTEKLAYLCRLRAGRVVQSRTREKLRMHWVDWSLRNAGGRSTGKETSFRDVQITA